MARAAERTERALGVEEASAVVVEVIVMVVVEEEAAADGGGGARTAEEGGEVGWLVTAMVVVVKVCKAAERTDAAFCVSVTVDSVVTVTKLVDTSGSGEDNVAAMVKVTAVVKPRTSE